MKKILAVLSLIALTGCDSLEYQIAVQGMCDDAFGPNEIICKCVQHQLEDVEPPAEFQAAFVALMDGDLFGADSDAIEEVRLTIAELYMVCGAKSLGY